MNKKLIIIEDAPFCSILVKKMIIGLPFEIIRLEHVDQLQNIEPLRDEDIILLDLIGTGSEKLDFIEHEARVIKMSSNKDLNPDLIKPFYREDLMNILYPETK